MTGGHHVLEEAASPHKNSQPHNRLHIYRVPINSLRHQIAATVLPDASVSLDRDMHINSSVNKGAWLKLREQCFSNKVEAKLGSEVLLCWLNAQTNNGFKTGNSRETRNSFRIHLFPHVP